ncbi:hypothetical protein GJ744_002607 [Endocarpon pusillum]|uniref:Uncharacterized protein n=1 Tax=Endocarpon pusillum TaxID=364733 RepID=A0A8H7A8N8_9EURO|nr:hypothetical protein GJ744_002607 [Endocarpon pusillum]
MSLHPAPSIGLNSTPQQETLTTHSAALRKDGPPRALRFDGERARIRITAYCETVAKLTRQPSDTLLGIENRSR